MSYKGQVRVFKDYNWYDNGLRFATEAEADAYISDLFSRWAQVEAYRVAPSTDPVNYRFDFDSGRAVRIPMEVRREQEG